jgi:phosphoglucosamine mutase
LSTLFGTDGIRGIALQPPLDRSTVTRLGAALAEHLRAEGRPVSLLLAGDTRASTPVLARWLASSFTEAGGTVSWAGVLPTPAVSHLLRLRRAWGAGVVVSASHNPAEDNGIKLVSAGGSKWPVREETALENRMAMTAESAGERSLPAPAGDLGRDYLRVLAATLPERPLAGWRLVIDAANGAASAVAASFFTGLGATVTMINAEPDGANINKGCGALHPESLAARVAAEGADGGVAFDGDADRAILVADGGRILDGDDILYVWARDLAARSALPGRAIVATVMSNLGLEVGLEALSVRVVRCPVGDRDVSEAMVREGLVLGGEQSGHVICAHHAVTGDGLLTAAHLFAIAAGTGCRLSELANLEHFPQVLLNVPVAHRRPLAEVEPLHRAVADRERELDGHGRVYVRYSGTEPLLRIMVEAPTRDQAEAIANALAAIARGELSAA